MNIVDILRTGKGNIALNIPLCEADQYASELVPEIIELTRSTLGDDATMEDALDALYATIFWLTCAASQATYYNNQLETPDE